MTIKPAFAVAAPGGARAKLSILIFHRVLPEQDTIFPGEMFARRFDDVCRSLSNWFNVLPLDRAITHLVAGSLPPRAACITFDDGYADNLNVAVPILRRHGLEATFFVATGFLDGGRMWNDSIIESIRQCANPTVDVESLDLGLRELATRTNLEKQLAIAALIDKIKYRKTDDRLQIVDRLARLTQVALPSYLMMTSEEVKAIRRAGMQIGAHTISHPILTRSTDEEAAREIAGGKTMLENLIQEPVNMFAYPNGKPERDYAVKHVQMVREAGFLAAVSTAPGVSISATDLFQLPRFTPWDTGIYKFGLRLLMNTRLTRTDVAC
jgi:peptidoglycan/xylan/chitin deacetylase (PgdA/CDA1 family)